MLRPPLLQPFCFSSCFLPFAKVPMVDSILEVTNAQKLSLSTATAIGTQVHVTDGFVVSGYGDSNVDGFYAPNGNTTNGKPEYGLVGAIDVEDSKCLYNGANWFVAYGSASAAVGNEDFPWQADWSVTFPVLVLTHPAVQQLAAASTAQGGVAVLGGTVDGIYTGQGTANSKEFYDILGTAEADPDNGVVKWDGSQWSILDGGGSGVYYSLSDVATPDLVPNGNPVFVIDFNNLVVSDTDYGSCGAGQFIASFQPGDVLANSTVNFTGSGSAFFTVYEDDSPTKQQIITKLVALGAGKITDLGGLKIQVSPTNRALVPLDFGGMTGSDFTAGHGNGWLDANSGSSASITVTSVSVGEIYAGLAVTNDGVTNGSSYVSQPFHGRQYYMGLNGGGSNNMHWDTTFNVWTDDVGAWTTSNVAFPWQGTDNGGGHTGATFARNNVATEANWDTV